jgi:hypothetical protein
VLDLVPDLEVESVSGSVAVDMQAVGTYAAVADM